MKPAPKIELDPILTAQIVYEGATRLRNQTGEEPNLREVIWYLLEEAVKVDRSISKPGPSRHVTMQIQTYWEPHEIVAAYNEALTEIRDAEKKERLPETYYEPDKPKPQADSMAHRRYLEVMGWLRVVTAKTRIRANRRQALILALASGMPPRVAVDEFPEENFPDRKAVSGARERALNQIEEAIKRACKKLAVAA